MRLRTAVRFCCVLALVVPVGVPAAGRAAVAPARSVADTPGGLEPAGDLDGDGRVDLLETRDRSFAVRRDDGTLRWWRAYAGDVVVRPMRLGAAGRPGLLVAERIWDEATGGATAKRILHAYDGGGAAIWTREYQAAGAVGAGSVGWPDVRGVADILPGPAEDVVVARTTYVSGTAYVPITSVLDGTDGSETAPVRTLPCGVGPDGPCIGFHGPKPVDDLDGDRLADLVASVVLADGRTLVQATRGREGTPLWAVPLDGGEVVSSTSVGDVTGDRIAEVVVTTVTVKPAWTVTVFDGATGVVLFSRPGRDVYVVRRGAAPLLAVVDRDPYVHWLSWSVVRLDGTVRGTTRIGLTRPGGTDPYVSAGRAGDVNGDGYVDGYFGGSCLDRGARAVGTVGGVVDGRTGRVLWRGRYAVRPAGTQLVGFELRPGARSALALLDGRTGRARWRLDTPVRGPFDVYVAPLPLPGRGCPGLVASVVSVSGFSSFVADSGTGRVTYTRWPGLSAPVRFGPPPRCRSSANQRAAQVSTQV